MVSIPQEEGQRGATQVEKMGLPMRGHQFGREEYIDPKVRYPCKERRL